MKKWSLIKNLEEAIGQMTYRLQNGRYEPNQKDVEAFKFVAEWINRAKTEELTQNVLFAKLFCHVFAQEVEHYKGDFKLAQKKMHEYLALPIEHYYEVFSEDINRIAMNLYLESIGLTTDKHPFTRSEYEKAKETETIKQHQAAIHKHLGGKYPVEKLYYSLNNTITEFINKYKNDR